MLAAGEDGGCGAGWAFGAGVADRKDPVEDRDQESLDEALVDLGAA